MWFCAENVDEIQSEAAEKQIKAKQRPLSKETTLHQTDVQNVKPVRKMLCCCSAVQRGSGGI